jgi:ABC-type glycerol-3-phosphate transport system permease component
MAGAGNQDNHGRSSAVNGAQKASGPVARDPTSEGRRTIVPGWLRPLLVYAIMVALAVLFLMPVVWALSGSLKSLDQVYEYPPDFWPDAPKWENYPNAVRKLPFVRFLLNTLFISLMSAAGTVLTASMAGYAFARLHWPARTFWFGAVLATMLIPQQVLMIPEFLVFRSLGWVDTYKPLIVPAWLGGGGFFVFLFRQFFLSLPRDVEEAAVLDGASPWQVYRQVLLPMARPAVVTVAVLAFLHSWHDLMGPLIYLSSFEKFPISLGLRMYQTLEGTWVNLLMAASVIAALPVAILFLIAQRQIVRGLQF